MSRATAESLIARMKAQEESLEKVLAEAPEDSASHLRLALQEIRQAIANLEQRFATSI